MDVVLFWLALFLFSFHTVNVSHSHFNKCSKKAEPKSHQDSHCTTEMFLLCRDTQSSLSDSTFRNGFAENS